MSSGKNSETHASGAALIIAHGLHHDRFGDRLAIQSGGKTIVGRRVPDFGSEGIGDTRISSRHVEVQLDGDELAVDDLQSKNGVLFNERRLSKVRLLDGQAMQIGSTFLVFRRDACPTRVEGGMLIGSGTAINRTRDRISTLADKGVSVSVTGPAGSEKDLVARELHAQSGRAGEFVQFDLAATPAPRQEAALFGESGAWAAARGGTLFIEDLPRLAMPLQGRLAAALETHHPSDPRVVVALSPDFGDRHAKGDVDSALFDRLALAQVDCPPLRERPEDLGALCRYCLTRSSYGRLGISSRLMWALLRNPWPGELRALERLLTNQAMSAPRGSEFLDLNPTTDAFLEHQRRIYEPASQDDATVDIASSPT